MTYPQEQVNKRRTFAIISHPDAGKTTITEKVLLYGNAIQKAGSVKGKGSDAAREIRLDGNGETTWDFYYHFRDAIPIQRLFGQPA